MKSKIQLSLFQDSWANLFECIHANGSRIDTRGNFWAAIQELERQFDDEANTSETSRER